MGSKNIPYKKKFKMKVDKLKLKSILENQVENCNIDNIA